MHWRRGGRSATRDTAPRAQVAAAMPDGPAWEYLVEEGSLDPGWTEQRCNDRGAEGWELVGVVPLSRPTAAAGGRTTGLQLFFKRQLL